MVLHGYGDPSPLVHSDDRDQADIPHSHELAGLSELDPPRNLVDMQRGGVGRVYVHQPVRRADIDYLPNYQVPYDGHVLSRKGEHAYRVGPDALDSQLRGEYLSALRIRSWAGLLARYRKEVTGNDDLSRVFLGVATLHFLR